MKLLNIGAREGWKEGALPSLQSVMVMEQIGLCQGSLCESVFELIKMSGESLLLISPHCSTPSHSLRSVCRDSSAFDSPIVCEFLADCGSASY